jgi:cytochrome P450
LALPFCLGVKLLPDDRAPVHPADRSHAELGGRSGRELRGYFGEIIADRRKHTRNDLMSQLIEAEVDGRQLSDDEIYPFLLLLLPAGAETTYRSSSNLLFGHPDQLDAVRADRGLVPQAIEEALRWDNPLLTVARLATEDAELGGVRIPARGFVAVSLGAANRDPERYADPDAFDIFRGGRRTCRSATGRTSAWGCTWPGWRCGCWSTRRSTGCRSCGSIRTPTTPTSTG